MGNSSLTRLLYNFHSISIKLLNIFFQSSPTEFRNSYFVWQYHDSTYNYNIHCCILHESKNLRNLPTPVKSKLLFPDKYLCFALSIVLNYPLFNSDYKSTLQCCIFFFIYGLGSFHPSVSPFLPTGSLKTMLCSPSSLWLVFFFK